MKKLIFILPIFLVAMALNSCTNNLEPNVQRQSQNLHGANGVDIAAPENHVDSLLREIEEEHKTIEKNLVISKSKEIPVGEKNFKKLVTFIEKNGFVVPQKGVSCDYQYTFFDSHGNRHALITIKRDKDGNPSTKGTVDQISIWAYYKGIKDQEHYFGYRITSEKVGPFHYDIDGGWTHADAVKFGYEEFLAKALK